LLSTLADGQAKGGTVERFKTLGQVGIGILALVLAFGAATSSAAQFRSESYPAQISGEQTEFLNVVYFEFKTSTGGAARLKCFPNTFAGSLSGPSSSLQVPLNFPGNECELGASRRRLKRTAVATC
jgi:hypothetical protein